MSHQVFKADVSMVAGITIIPLVMNGRHVTCMAVPISTFEGRTVPAFSLRRGGLTHVGINTVVVRLGKRENE